MLKASTFNIYQNRNRIKWIIVFFTLLLGFMSLVFTSILVKQLADRELQQIQLYAKSLEFLSSPDNSDDLNFIFSHVITSNTSIPVILVDESGTASDFKNFTIPEELKFYEDRQLYLQNKLDEMQQVYEPIKVKIDKDITHYIYYTNSDLIVQLTYYPYVQLSVVLVVFILGYIIFSTSRRYEQNRVWVGLAKETAHQLGTPISSLMAWIEFFKSDPNFDTDIILELEKDTAHLRMITDRFSNIGSDPSFDDKDLAYVVENIVDYLKVRVSTKVKFKVVAKQGQDLTAHINQPLFEWVIENICKNAVDAMSGIGNIDLYIRKSPDKKTIVIDIKDTGKGIPKNKIKTIFQAGYTTKKRGWGLGLTLAKRIIVTYHKGEIVVKKSNKDGTTFRITIPK